MLTNTIHELHSLSLSQMKYQSYLTSKSIKSVVVVNNTLQETCSSLYQCYGHITEKNLFYYSEYVHDIFLWYEEALFMERAENNELSF